MIEVDLGAGENLGERVEEAPDRGRRERRESLGFGSRRPPQKDVAPQSSPLAELGAWAERLEREFAAPRTAAFVREALAVYARRGLLAVDERSPAQV